jgi:hypothetical protein
MLGVHGKLVKYVVHSSKRKNWKKNSFFFTQATQTAIDQFLVSRNFRGLAMANLTMAHYMVESTKYNELVGSFNNWPQPSIEPWKWYLFGNE